MARQEVTEFDHPSAPPTRTPTQKPKQETTEVPPSYSRTYHIDVQIRIYPEQTRYKADISTMGQMQQLPIRMSSTDLENLNKQLQERMQDVADTSVKTIEPTAQLHDLAEAGNFAFKKVFGHYSDTITKLLGIVAESLAFKRQISIQVIAEDFFLPWELIYPVSLDEPLSYERFWGMNYIISRRVVQDVQPGDFVKPDIQFASRPNLGLLTDNELPSVAKEILFFENLENDNKIRLTRLRPLIRERPKEVEEFKRFLREPFNLVHFACHASYEQPPEQSFILLSNAFSITLMSMEVNDIVINDKPLVIMNACDTGNLNPKCTSYFAAAFLKYGARGVVATECKVSDVFAASFAEQLYTNLLLEGKQLGESLLATRRYFWEKGRNPSGLLYSMYAPPSIRLSRLGE